MAISNLIDVYEEIRRRLAEQQAQQAQAPQQMQGPEPRPVQGPRPRPVAQGPRPRPMQGPQPQRPPRPMQGPPTREQFQRQENPWRVQVDAVRQRATQQAQQSWRDMWDTADDVKKEVIASGGTPAAIAQVLFGSNQIEGGTYRDRTPDEVAFYGEHGYWPVSDVARRLGPSAININMQNAERTEEAKAAIEKYQADLAAIENPLTRGLYMLWGGTGAYGRYAGTKAWNALQWTQFPADYVGEQEAPDAYFSPNPFGPQAKVAETEGRNINQQLGPYLSVVNKLYGFGNRLIDPATNEPIDPWTAIKGTFKNPEKLWNIAANEVERQHSRFDSINESLEQVRQSDPQLYNILRLATPNAIGEASWQENTIEWMTQKYNTDEMYAQAEGLMQRGMQEEANLLYNKAKELDGMSYQDIVNKFRQPSATLMQGLFLDPTNFIPVGIIGDLRGVGKVLNMAGEAVDSAGIAKYVQEGEEVLNAIQTGAGKIAPSARSYGGPMATWAVLGKTPESRAAIDSNILTSAAARLFAGVQNPEDFRQLFQTWVNDPEGLVKGISNLTSPALAAQADDAGKVFRGSAGVIGKNVLERNAILKLIEPRLDDLDAMKPGQFSVERAVAELDDLIHEGARQAHGLVALDELPYGAATISRQGDTLTFLGDEGQFIGTRQYASPAEAAQMEKATKAAATARGQQNPFQGIWNTVRVLDKTQRAAMSALWLNLRPGHMFRNAFGATGALGAEGILTFEHMDSILDAANAKVVLGLTARGLQGALDNMGQKSRVVSGWGTQSISRSQHPNRIVRMAQNAMNGVHWQGNNNLFGIIPTGEQAFYTRGLWAGFQKSFNPAWRRVVKEQNNYRNVLKSLGLSDEAANTLLDIATEAGVNGGRTDIAEAMRSALYVQGGTPRYTPLTPPPAGAVPAPGAAIPPSGTLPTGAIPPAGAAPSPGAMTPPTLGTGAAAGGRGIITFPQLRIRPEDISLKAARQIQGLMNRYNAGRMNWQDFANAANKVLDTDELGQGSVLLHNPTSPGRHEWQTKEILAESAFLADEIYSGALSATGDPVAARAMVRQFVEPYLAIEKQTLQSISEFVKNSPDSRQSAAVAVRAWSELYDMRSQLRNRIDNITRAAVGGNAGAWKKRMDAVGTEYAKHAENAKGLLQKVKSGQYTGEDTHIWSLIQRALRYDQATMGNIASGMGQAEELTEFAKYLDQSYTGLTQAVAMHPNPESIDILLGTIQKNDEMSSQLGAYMSQLAEAVQEGRLSTDQAQAMRFEAYKNFYRAIGVNNHASARTVFLTGAQAVDGGAAASKVGRRAVDEADSLMDSVAGKAPDLPGAVPGRARISMAGGAEEVRVRQMMDALPHDARIKEGTLVEWGARARNWARMTGLPSDLWWRKIAEVGQNPYPTKGALKQPGRGKWAGLEIFNPNENVQADYGMAIVASDGDTPFHRMRPLLSGVPLDPENTNLYYDTYDEFLTEFMGNFDTLLKKMESGGQKAPPGLVASKAFDAAFPYRMRIDKKIGDGDYKVIPDDFERFRKEVVQYTNDFFQRSGGSAPLEPPTQLGAYDPRRQANFEKFFDGSAITGDLAIVGDKTPGKPLRMYRGTQNHAIPYDAEDMGKISDGLFGPGIYYTDNPDIAAGKVMSGADSTTIADKAEAEKFARKLKREKGNRKGSVRIEEVVREPFEWETDGYANGDDLIEYVVHWEYEPRLVNPGYAAADLNTERSFDIDSLETDVASNLSDYGLSALLDDRTSAEGITEKVLDALFDEGGEFTSAVRGMADEWQSTGTFAPVSRPETAKNRLWNALSAKARKVGIPEEDGFADAISDVVQELITNKRTDYQRVPTQTFADYLSIKNPFDIDKLYSRQEVESLFGGPTVALKVIDKNASDMGIGAGSAMRGEEIYKTLQRHGGGHFAYEVLKDAGFDGVTHIGGGRTGNAPHRVVIAFEPNQVKSAYGNVGTFDPKNPSRLMQEKGEEVLGWMGMLEDGRRVFNVLENGDASTFAHETAHMYLFDLMEAAKYSDTAANDLEYVKNWAKVVGDEWTDEAHELFARTYEEWRRTGKAPIPELESVFEQFKQWLTEIYRRITQSGVVPDTKIDKRISEVYGNLLTPDAYADGRLMQGTRYNPREATPRWVDGANVDVGGVRGKIEKTKAGEWSITLENGSTLPNVPKDAPNVTLVPTGRAPLRHPAEKFEPTAFEGWLPAEAPRAATGNRVVPSVDEVGVRRMKASGLIDEATLPGAVNMLNSHLKGILDPDTPLTVKSFTPAGWTKVPQDDKFAIAYYLQLLTAERQELSKGFVLGKGSAEYAKARRRIGNAMSSWKVQADAAGQRYPWIPERLEWNVHNPMAQRRVGVPHIGDGEPSLYDRDTLTVNRLLGLEPDVEDANILDETTALMLENAGTQADPTFGDVASSGIRALAQSRRGLSAQPAGAQIQVTPAQAKAIMDMVTGRMLPEFDNIVAGATKVGERMADAAMLNGNDRRYIDGFLSTIMPYHFFWTRSARNWAARTLKKPRWTNLYDSTERSQELYENQEGNVDNRYEGLAQLGTNEDGEPIMVQNPLNWVFPWIQLGEGNQFIKKDQGNTNFEKVYNNYLYNTAGMFPTYQLMLNDYFDRTDPLPDGDKRANWDIRTYIPQVGNMSNISQMLTGKSMPFGIPETYPVPLGAQQGEQAGVGVNPDALEYNIGNEAARQDLSGGMTTEQAAWVQQYAYNQRNGRPLFENIPPDKLQETAVRALGTEKGVGVEMFLAGLSYWVGLNLRVKPHQDAQMSAMQDAYGNLGYSEDNPYGGKELKQDYLAERPEMLSIWNRGGESPYGAPGVQATSNQVWAALNSAYDARGTMMQEVMAEAAAATGKNGIMLPEEIRQIESAIYAEWEPVIAELKGMAEQVGAAADVTPEQLRALPEGAPFPAQGPQVAPAGPSFPEGAQSVQPTAAPAGGMEAALSSGEFQLPFDPSKMSQGFGANPPRYAQFDLAGHEGLDWIIPEGTPINPVATGTVNRTGFDKTGYGNYVVVSHADGSETLYAHLSSIGVKQGQEVTPTTQLGLSGNTGNSDAPHLHLGWRPDAGTTDGPMKGWADPRGMTEQKPIAPGMHEDEMFRQGLEFVLSHEDGYQDYDSAGGTMKGITIDTLRSWRQSQGMPPPTIEDLKNISTAEVAEIYKQRYWNGIVQPDMSPALALVHFDTAVNAGPGRAAKLLESSGGDPNVYLDQREQWYRSLNDFGKYGKGWLNRVDDLRERIKTLPATPEVTPMAPLPAGGNVGPNGEQPQAAQQPSGVPLPKMPSFKDMNPTEVRAALDKWAFDNAKDMPGRPDFNAIVTEPKGGDGALRGQQVAEYNDQKDAWEAQQMAYLNELLNATPEGAPAGVPLPPTGPKLLEQWNKFLTQYDTPQETASKAYEKEYQAWFQKNIKPLYEAKDWDKAREVWQSNPEYQSWYERKQALEGKELPYSAGGESSSGDSKSYIAGIANGEVPDTEFGQKVAKALEDGWDAKTIQAFIDYDSSWDDATKKKFRQANPELTAFWDYWNDGVSREDALAGMGNGYTVQNGRIAYWSDDGLVSYDRYGRRLDSIGNVARGFYPSSGGGYSGGGGSGGGAGFNRSQVIQIDPRRRFTREIFFNKWNPLGDMGGQDWFYAGNKLGPEKVRGAGTK